MPRQRHNTCGAVGVLFLNSLHDFGDASVDSMVRCNAKMLRWATAMEIHPTAVPCFEALEGIFAHLGALFQEVQSQHNLSSGH